MYAFGVMGFGEMKKELNVNKNFVFGIGVTEEVFLWGRVGFFNWVGWCVLFCVYVFLIDYIVLDLCIKNMIFILKVLFCYFVVM